MALPDEPPVKITYSDYRRAGDSELEHWLRKEVAEKTAEAKDSSDVEPPALEVYPEPPEEKRPEDFSGAATSTARDVKQGVLDRVFRHSEEGRARTHDCLREYFEHAEKDTYQKRMTEFRTKEGSANAPPATGLAARVRRVVGRS